MSWLPCPSQPAAVVVVGAERFALGLAMSWGRFHHAVDPPFTRSCGCLRQPGENCAQVQANSCACAAASNKNASANAISWNCSLPQKDLVDDPENLGQSAMVQDAPDFRDGLIGEREKHKDSVEYKRAAEEEWASRQRQLLKQV